MSSILSALYAGAYNPQERPYSAGNAYSRKLREAEELESELSKGMPDALKKTFAAYREACAELSFSDRQEEYEEGFKLGVRLMIAALLPEKE